MRGQLSERERDWSGARRAYAAGLARCPGSVPLWVSAARLEERAAAPQLVRGGGAGADSTANSSNNSAGSSRARALLEQARLATRRATSSGSRRCAPRRAPRGSGPRARDAGVSASGAAAAGLSGRRGEPAGQGAAGVPSLRASCGPKPILTAPRPSRRSTSVDALKKCDDDPLSSPPSRASLRPTASPIRRGRGTRGP